VSAARFSFVREENLMQNLPVIDTVKNAIDPSRIGEISRNEPELKPETADNSEQTLENTAAVISLSQFVADFGDGLMQAVSQQNPPVYDGTPDPARDIVMDGLKRDPFPAQREVVQAVTRLLLDAGEDAAVINAEMGTGKSMMAICVAAVMQEEFYRRCLIISPPHMVYKWRREILETLPDAKVRVLNGPDTLRQLLKIRDETGRCQKQEGPAEFFIIGRVRMRLGFDWKPAILRRKRHERVFTEVNNRNSSSYVRTAEYAACPDCGVMMQEEDGGWIPANTFIETANDKQCRCSDCGAALWTLKRSGASKDRAGMIRAAMCRLPTIGPKTAERLLSTFGPEALGGMLADNPYDFVNLMDADGELVFSDRQAARMERRLANQEFAFGQGGYQATEFVKRYLPQGFFDLLVVDEGHEYKVRHEVA